MFRYPSRQRIGFVCSLLLLAVSLLDLLVQVPRGKTEPVIVIGALFFALCAYVLWRQLRQAPP